MTKTNGGDVVAMQARYVYGVMVVRHGVFDEISQVFNADFCTILCTAAVLM